MVDVALALALDEIVVVGVDVDNTDFEIAAAGAACTTGTTATIEESLTNETIDELAKFSLLTMVARRRPTVSPLSSRS